MDDTFLLFCSTEHVEKFKKYLNKQHKKTSFTSEMKQNGSLSFLDIKINCENTKLDTSGSQSSKAMATLRTSSTHAPYIF